MFNSGVLLLSKDTHYKMFIEDYTAEPPLNKVMPHLFGDQGWFNAMRVKFDFDVFDQPTANAVIDYELCDDSIDGDDTNRFSTFDLASLDPQVLLTQNATQFDVSY